MTGLKYIEAGLFWSDFYHSLEQDHLSGHSVEVIF